MHTHAYSRESELWHIMHDLILDTALTLRVMPTDEPSGFGCFSANSAFLSHEGALLEYGRATKAINSIIIVTPKPLYD